MHILAKFKKITLKNHYEELSGLRIPQNNIFAKNLTLVF